MILDENLFEKYIPNKPKRQSIKLKEDKGPDQPFRNRYNINTHYFDDVKSMVDAFLIMKDLGISVKKLNKNDYLLTKGDNKYTFSVLSDDNMNRAGLERAVQVLNKKEEAVVANTVRGPYKKPAKPAISYNKIYDKLEDLGYIVRASDRLDNGIVVSKKHEKNLQKAKDYCKELGLECNQRFSPVQQRYYLDITLPKDLKESTNAAGLLNRLGNNDIEYFSLKNTLGSQTQQVKVDNKNKTYEFTDPYVKTVSNSMSIKNGREFEKAIQELKNNGYKEIQSESLKEDLILDPTEEDKKLLNDLLDKYKGTEYERILDQLKSKYEFEDTFGEKEEPLKEEHSLENKPLKELLPDDFDSLPKEERVKILTAENNRKELLTAINRIGELVNSKSPILKSDWKLIKNLLRDNNLLKEDLSQEEQQEYGLNTLINELIKSEYDAIDEYNSAIVTLEAENQGEYTDVIRSIIEDERHHIGNLQEIMNRITPGTEQEFDKGKEEAEQTLSEEPKEEVETIKDVELEDSALQG